MGLDFQTILALVSKWIPRKLDMGLDLEKVK